MSVKEKLFLRGRHFFSLCISLYLQILLQHVLQAMHGIHLQRWIAHLYSLAFHDIRIDIFRHERKREQLPHVCRLPGEMSKYETIRLLLNNSRAHSEWSSPCPSSSSSFIPRRECSTNGTECASNQWCHVGKDKDSTVCCSGGEGNWEALKCSVISVYFQW